MSDDADVDTQEKKVSFTKIGNLEAVKRAFCNKEFAEFRTLLTQEPQFLFKTVEYNYAEDYDGRPEFIMKNKNRGFVQNVDKLRAYFFIAFSCFKKDDHVHFKSFWIVNTTDDLKTVLEDDYDDFTFTDSTVDEVVEGFKTGGHDDYLSLELLH